jgi:hypothetical protein
MFNIKWGGICAGTAFVLALALSLIIGQTGLPIALLRAAVFAVLFFGLGIAAWSLINTFIPDLITTSPADITTHLFSTDAAAGSRVNITVGDAKNAALPEQGYDASGNGNVDNFNDLFSPKQDIDQIPATGYTEDGEAGELSAAETGDFSSAFTDVGMNEEEEEGEGESGEFSMDFSAFVPGGLGDGGEADESSEAGAGSESDSGSGMDSFSFFPEAAPSATFDEPEEPERKVARNKPMKLEGDFDAKEIAAGLRTVLEKDKKG